MKERERAKESTLLWPLNGKYWEYEEIQCYKIYNPIPVNYDHWQIFFFVLFCSSPFARPIFIHSLRLLYCYALSYAIVWFTIFFCHSAACWFLLIEFVYSLDCLLKIAVFSIIFYYYKMHPLKSNRYHWICEPNDIWFLSFSFVVFSYSFFLSLEIIIYSMYEIDAHIFRVFPVLDTDIFDMRLCYRFQFTY